MDYEAVDSESAGRDAGGLDATMEGLQRAMQAADLEFRNGLRTQAV